MSGNKGKTSLLVCPSVSLSVSYLVHLKLAKTGGCDVNVIPTHACVRCQPERPPSLVPFSKSEVLIAAHNGWVQLKDYQQQHFT